MTPLAKMLQKDPNAPITLDGIQQHHWTLESECKTLADCGGANMLGGQLR